MSDLPDDAAFERAPRADVAEPVTRLVARSGVSAELRGAAGGEALRVLDAAGNLLFEHRPAEGVTVISVPQGDLELRAPAGSVRVVAGKRVEVRAAEAELKAAEVRLTARQLVATVDRVREVVGVLELRAERVVERAKNVYRDVEELAQTRAGRLKLIAERTVHVLGQRALVRAREDVKIKGEKVHLA